MNKYEVEKRLCEELNIDYIHLNLRTGPAIDSLKKSIKSCNLTMPNYFYNKRY